MVGLVAYSTNYWLGINNYFRSNDYRCDNYGEDLKKVPDKQEQIIWSQSHNDFMSELDVDRNWVRDSQRFAYTVFALHNRHPSKEQWDHKMQIELLMCKHKFMDDPCH